MIPAGSNRFISSLSDEDRDSILKHATALPAPIRMPFYEADKRPRHVFFITSGMASVVATTAAGGTAEVGIIGSEGFVGSLHLLGPAAVSTDSYMQLEGSVLRVPFSKMEALFSSSLGIRSRTLEFVQEQTIIVSHLVGCNRLHEAEPRLARWLLMARDRSNSDVLNFTQEFLGMMLGTNRTTVSLVAAHLQNGGAINYVRGQVTILDGNLLETMACDCYEITKRLHQQLYRREITGSLP